MAVYKLNGILSGFLLSIAVAISIPDCVRKDMPLTKYIYESGSYLGKYIFGLIYP